MKYVFPLSWRSSYVLSTWTFSGTVRVCVCVCSDFLLLLCHLPFHDFYVTLCHSEIICTWFYLVSQSFPLCLLQHCLPSLSPMVFLVFLLDSRAPELSLWFISSKREGGGKDDLQALSQGNRENVKLTGGTKSGVSPEPFRNQREASISCWSRHCLMRANPKEAGKATKIGDKAIMRALHPTRLSPWVVSDGW